LYVFRCHLCALATVTSLSLHDALPIYFPTDVVAGASFGLASALISLAVYIHVRHSLIAFLEKLKLNDESSLLKQRSRKKKAPPENGRAQVCTLVTFRSPFSSSAYKRQK